jgi:hypothetical protein
MTEGEWWRQPLRLDEAVALAANPRERDEADFEAVLPVLDDAARVRLPTWLSPDHSWRNRIERRDVL